MQSIIPIDLKFLGRKKAIAAYLIPHKYGAALVETGPGSTCEELTNQLDLLGYKPNDISHVFITHIHLDHAGAAGWLAKQGAQIFVHPIGESHLKNPEKLLASARRIYGDKMDLLWGEFLPVPSEKLSVVLDQEQVISGDLTFTAIHTPGHAEHHISWLFEDTCFTGDVGGVRIPGFSYIRLPLVPPELHFGKWRDSLVRLEEFDFRKIAPTHFGIFEDAKLHLKQARQMLEDIEKWMDNIITEDISIESLREQYVTFMNLQGERAGLGEEALRIYEIANPTWMGADGIYRYRKKFVEGRM
jgi:glyoxylase-like metal-dependent hydrolase (beta-lactamase superfamily II)